MWSSSRRPWVQQGCGGHGAELLMVGWGLVVLGSGWHPVSEKSFSSAISAFLKCLQLAGEIVPVSNYVHMLHCYKRIFLSKIFLFEVAERTWF